ncbi:MAG: ABC transporter permease [Candidatus Heimdallarchaeota archaeon]
MEMSLPQNDNESVTIEPTIIGEKPKKSKRKEKKETEKLPRDNKVYFGMFMIFKKTFTEMFGATRVIAYVLLSVIFPFIYSNVVAENLVVPLSDLNINFQIATVVSHFAFHSFFWNAGILLFLFCGLSASTFISGEENNGTLIFLLTKPIRRSTVFFGKFLGYFVNMAILQLFSLFLGLTITCSAFQVSFEVFLQSLLYLVPVYLFALMMIIIVGLIMGFMSIVSKKVVVNVVLIMLAIIVIYFVGILLRLALPGYYETFYLYIIDLGYNLSTIFLLFLKPFGFQPIPTFQQNFGLFFGTYVNQFTNLSAFLGASDVENNLTFLLAETNYIHPLISLTVLIVITVVLLIIGIVVLERKDVGG